MNQSAIPIASSALRRDFKFSPLMITEDPNLYHLGGLHPVHLGDMLKENRYQIVHKLGFGNHSTVWLARDLFKSCYVAVKIHVADNHNFSSNEFTALRQLNTGSESHPGRQFIMILKDEFSIEGPNGTHHCCVIQVAGVRLARPPNTTFSALGPARKIACQVLQALEYIHSCEIVHGDIWIANVLQQVGTFDHLSKEELYECIGVPFQEKVEPMDQTKLITLATPKYLVHSCNLAGLGKRFPSSKIVIIDFGSSFPTFESPDTHIALPQASPPEILFGSPISSAIDIWAAGCLIFEICAGYTLFKALFNRRQDIRKDMVAMLGKPPESLWKLWPDRECYFDADGIPKKVDNRILAKLYPLSDRIRDMTRLYSDGRPIPTKQDWETENFPTIELAELYDLLSMIFVYDPESRLSPSMALEHPFVSKYV